MPSLKDILLEVLRRLEASEDLLKFIRFHNPDYIVSRFAEDVCAALKEFIADMEAGLRPILILAAPPQHGKSEIVSRYLPAFILGRNPSLSIGGLSYGKSLAADMNRDVQRIMLSDEYGQIFPDTKLNTTRATVNGEMPKRNSETFEVIGDTGRYVSQGVGGPLTGKRLDVGIIDDPIKNSQEALSHTVKESVWNWYVTTFLTRLSKNSGQIIMATSWATDDLSHLVAKANPRAKFIKFPAIDEDGNALVPALHPLEKLLETKATMSGYFWSALYLQNPLVLGGLLIRGEWFSVYSTPPIIKYRAIYADTAMKTGEHNDYSVFQLWGKGEDGKAYLLDMIRGKWEAPELERRAISFWQKHKQEQDILRWGRLRQMKVEDKASGTGLIQKMKKDGKIPIVGIERVKDKYTRLMDVLGYIEAGMVAIPENAFFVSDFVAECEAMTPDDTHLHDDQIDPMIDAIGDLIAKGSGFKITEALLRAI